MSDEEQDLLMEEFGDEARKKGIAYELKFMAGAIAFGSKSVKNKQESEIMRDLIQAVKKANNNQEFLDYMYETYISKMIED